MTNNTENTSVGINKYFPIEKIFATSFILKVVELFSGFFVNFFLSRILSTADYGKFVYGFNMVYLLATLSAFGFEHYLVKETARLKQLGEKTRLKSLHRFTNFFVLGLSILFALGLAAVSYWQNNQYSASLILQSLLIPVAALAFVNQAFVRGNENIFDFLFPLNTLRPLLFLTILITYYFSVTDMGLFAAIGFNIVTYTIGFLYLLFVTRKAYKQAELKTAKPTYEGNIWLKQSLYFAFMSMLALLNNRIDVFILGLFRAPEEVGVFGIASRIACLTPFMLMAFNTAYSGLIARKYTAGETDELQKVITKNVRVIAVLTLVFVLSLYLFGDKILFWFGKDYEQGFLAMLIISTAHLISVAFGPVGNVLTMTGFENRVTQALIVSGIVSVALSFILVPKFGFIGTAIASAASILTWNFIEFYFCLKKSKINTSFIGKL